MIESGYQNPSIENFSEFVKAFQELNAKYEDLQRTFYVIKRKMEGAIYSLRQPVYKDVDAFIEQPEKISEKSGIPTSKEDISSQVKHRTRSIRKKSGKKPGGQKGHSGCTMNKTDAPDEIEHDASLVCGHCGCELGRIRHQRGVFHTGG